MFRDMERRLEKLERDQETMQSRLKAEIVTELLERIKYGGTGSINGSQSSIGAGLNQGPYHQEWEEVKFPSSKNSQAESRDPTFSNSFLDQDDKINYFNFSND